MTQLPTHVSHYEIVRVLGQGGMGTVYLALDPGLRRQVALKVLRADSDDQRERFRREARIVARLQHPNIVAIYAVGEHDRQLYIAMEYIDGEPLSDAIRRRVPWGLHKKLQMAADLCSGLAFAHRAGVIHRDVKPSNLIVSNGSGTLRLLDFGIARGADPAVTMGLTMHGNIVGTLNYMSPEQITGQALDHRSDIFAVGLVLYELLAYRQAFPGDNLATLTYRIVHGGADPLRQLMPDLDEELCTIVERAMAQAPDDRYPHLEAMRTDVLRVAARLSPESAALVTGPALAGSLVASGAPRIWSRALDVTVLADGQASPGSTARLPDAPLDETVGVAWPGRPSRLALGAGAAALILTVAAAVWVTRPGEPVAAPPIAKASTPGEAPLGPAPSTPVSPPPTPSPAAVDPPADADLLGRLAGQLTSGRRALAARNWSRAYGDALPPIIPAAAQTTAVRAALAELGTVRSLAVTRSRDEALQAEQTAVRNGAGSDALAGGRRALQLARSQARRDPLEAIRRYGEASDQFARGPQASVETVRQAPEPPVGPPAPITGATAGSAGAASTSAEGTPAAVVGPPPPVVAATPAARDEDLVSDVVLRWARAYSAMDVDAVNQLQPGARRALEKQFTDLQSVTVTLAGCQISVQGARATAQCREQMTARSRDGKNFPVATRQRNFTLQKSDAGWRIDSTTFR